MGPKKQRDPADVSNPELDAYIDTLNPDPTDLIVTYKPECVQKIGNFASADSRYLFEYAGEGREHLNWEKVEHLSPKLYRMLREIQEQDAEDMRVHGRKFKHFIFSNIKSGTFGAKIVATALIDIFGMNLGYRAAKHQRLLKKDPNWGKIMLTDPDVLHATKGDNFYLLSSVGVFDQPLSTPMRKEILKRFNSRPDNVYGDLARIIIMDAGFKEGIDLFDIKYVHIFEPQTTLADQKQVIGRGTRTCGQKGLDFHPTKGWPLYVNIYDSVFDDGTEFKFRDAKTVHELYLKSMGIDLRMLNLAVDMERVYIMGAIDHDLNQNIHEFSTQGTHGGSPTFVGGAKASAVAAVSNACQQGVIQGLMLPYDYKEAQRIVNAEFKDLKWEKPEMKNLCGGASQSDGDSLGQSGGGFFDWLNPANWLSSSKEQQQPLQQPLQQQQQQPVQQQPVVGGAPSVITYNSTQKFVSEFFKPSLNRKGMLLSHSVGTGKCHARDTPIIMGDGSIKMVQDIQVGDQLMGDNSKPRNVLSLATGQDMMYRIVPTVNSYLTKGDAYVVNSEHILCLKRLDNTNDNNVLEIEVRDYLQLPEHIKNNLCGYRTGIDFETKPTMLDAYKVGVQIGHFECGEMPFELLTNDRETRLSLLAGIIDACGTIVANQYSMHIECKTLYAHIVYLCRSLGFFTDKLDGGIIIIGGKGIEEIPCKIRVETAANTNLLYSFTVEPVAVDTYYGFTLDGNNRYLLGDFTVTHNTCSAIAAATNSFETEGYTILWVTRTTLKNDIWKNMFDQICSATIGDALKKGLVSAAELEDPKRRMKLLSKAWAIRPMSYKQFSNLVSGKNALYKALVKRNGAADPLKKTLLIIDEAHKLYGESDLSAIERPDTTVLYESLMRSYEISGKDSVRLLLMTATPITTSPMELVQLINLCRERDTKIEDNFNLFAETYLDETGMFTKAGERRFLNEIAGHISHLNREKDARMFSQPVVSFVRVPLLSEPYYNQFDPQLVRGMAQARMQAIKKRIDNNAENIMAYKLAKTEENQIKGVCDEYEEPREQKACKKVMRKTLRNIKSHIRDTKRILRDENKEVRDEYKNINQSIKERVSQAKHMLDERRAFYGHRGSDSSNSSSSSSSSSNKSSLSEEEHKKSSSSSSSSKAGGGWETDDEEEEKKARELEPFNPTDKKPIPGLDDDYQKYRQSVFYNIKQKCRVQPKRATFNNYPKVQHHLTLVKGFETQIQNNRNALRQERKNAATRLKTMKQNSLKKGLTSIERATMQRAWKEDTKKTRRYFKERAQQVAYENRSIMEDVKLHKNQAKEYKKTLEKAYKKTKRLKTRLEKKRRRESLKLGKTMEELKADAIELTDEFKAKQRELREFIDTNRETMMDEINTEVGDIKHVAEETLKMKQALAMHKEAKQAEKAKRDAEKEEERERKAEEKARKEAEREKEREQKAEEKARKEEEKARKEAEKKQKQEERAKKEAAKKK